MHTRVNHCPLPCNGQDAPIKIYIVVHVHVKTLLILQYKIDLGFIPLQYM